MAEVVSTPSKSGGKLDTLSKDELLKLIKKQAINTKELKKRLEDVTAALKSEKAEILRLENEKKDWISHGVSAEFEKKNKITKKDKELELAAHLGKEMLAENDVLQQELTKVKSEHERAVKEYEDELDRMMQEKVTLEQTLQSMQEEYKNAKQEALDNREVLKCQKEEHKINISELQQQIKESHQQIKELKSKNKTLGDQMNSSSTNVNSKVKKIRDKLEEVMKENEAHKEQNRLLELDCKDRSEKMLDLDQELKRLRKEILDHQKQNKANQLEIDALNETNENLEVSFNDSQEKMKELNLYVNMVVSERNESIAYVKQLDESLVKVKNEKEKVTKTLKTTKTKLERASQMEEELKKQLGVIVKERDDLLKKTNKRNTKAKTKGKPPQKEEEAEAADVAMQQQIKELQDQINSLAEENGSLRQTALSVTQTNDGIHERYQNLQKDFDELRFEVDEVTSSKNVLHEENEKLMNEKNEITEKFKALQDVYQSCLLEKDSVVAQKAILENEVEEGVKSVQEMKTQLEKSNEEKEEMKKNLENLQIEIEKQKQADQEMFHSRDEETKATIVKLEGRIDELLNQMQRLNEEKLNQETELEELFKSHDDLLNKYDFECKERQRVENENRSLEERISQLEETKEEGQNGTSIDTLKEQIQQLEETIKELTTSRDYHQQDADLKDQSIKQLQDELEQVQLRNAELNSQNNKEVDKIFHEFEELDRQLNVAKEELHSVLAEKEALHVVNSDLETEKSNTEEILSNTVLSLEKLEEELKLERTEYEELHVKYLELEEKYTQQQQQQQQQQAFDTSLEKHQGDMNEKHSLIDTLQGELKELKHASLEKDNSIAKSQQKIQELNRQLEMLHENSTYESKISDELNLQLNGVKDELDSLRHAYNDARLELSAFKISEENYLNERHESEAAIEKLSMEITELQNSLRTTTTSKDEEIEKLRCDFQEKEQALRGLSENLKNSNECSEQTNILLTGKDVQITELTNKLGTLRIRCTEAENTVNDLREQLQASLSEKLEMQKHTDTLSQQVHDHSSELSSHKKHTEELITELHSLQEEKSRSEIVFKTLSHEKSVLENRISMLSEKIELCKSEKDSQATDTINELTASVSGLTERVSALQQENADLSESVRAKEIQYAELQSIVQEKEQLVESFKEALAKEVANGDVVQELEQLKIAHANAETELQSALNKMEELENALKDKSREVKEKTEKTTKLKNVAIKAKKELDNLRGKFKEERQALQQEIERLNEETNAFTIEITQQKTNCSKHEEEFEDMQKEIKLLQEQLSNEKASTSNTSSEKDDLVCKVDALTVSMTTCENQISELERTNTSLQNTITEIEKEKENLEENQENSKKLLEEKSKEIEELKSNVEELQKSLQSAHKETTQMNVMNLEIDDYLKTIENLNEKLQKKETHCDELELNAQTATEKQTALESEIASLKKTQETSEERTRKLKNLIVKLKKEIEELKKQETLHEEHEIEHKTTIEQLSQNVEELKLEISSLLADKEKLNTELQRKIESHQKSYQTIEVKYARSTNDLSAAHKAYEELKADYENYKVRAHNVLKQQKEKSGNAAEKKHKQEMTQMEEQMDKLKEELEKTKDELKRLHEEHDQLEEEYEQQSTVHAEFVKELTEKETGWKTRYKQVKEDSDLKKVQYEEKLKRLMKENTDLLQSSKDQLANLRLENEGYVEEISLLKEKLEDLKSTTLPDVTSSPELKRNQQPQQRKAKGSHLSLEFSKYSMERQEGEGMDQKDLEIIDTLSQRSSVPHTPLSPTAILENVLTADSPQTPLAMRDEVVHLKSALNTSTKKNEHMTALLRESEANASRLYDQAIVLKEEIRRLERNEKREQENLNLEYLKNVIIKFLKVTSVEREQLIPVLCTMLKLSDEEKTFIKTYAKGDDDTSTDDANSSWSSYMYRWTSIS